MGLFAKVKDILFEEEEITEPIKVEKKEERKIESKPREIEERPISRPIHPEKKVDVSPNPKVVSRSTPVSPKPPKTEDISERELFRTDNTFPFPEFDEEEFNNSLSRPKPKPKTTTNVLEYERKKRTKKVTEHGRFEKTEIREVVEKKKFKPSPIISPVYGILNEDYRIEDIKDKKDFAKDNMEIDRIRRKAFEQPTSSVELKKPDTTYYEEETITVKVKEPEEEKQKKVKTIDELLENTADVEIDIEEEPTEEAIINDKQPVQIPEEEYDEVDEELEELINRPKDQNKNEEFDDEDTLENDLFDLIDSMYDNREDGEF